MGWEVRPWGSHCPVRATHLLSAAVSSPGSGGLSQEELLQELGHCDLALTHTLEPIPMGPSAPLRAASTRYGQALGWAWGLLVNNPLPRCWWVGGESNGWSGTGLSSGFLPNPEPLVPGLDPAPSPRAHASLGSLPGSSGSDWLLPLPPAASWPKRWTVPQGSLPQAPCSPPAV